MNVLADIRAGLRGLADFPRRVVRRLEREGIRKAGGREPVLGFGGVLDDGRLIHGGAVKLLALRDGFRCSGEEFNILYLVSSAQPEFAEDLAEICGRRGIRFVWNQNGVGYPGWAGSEAGRHNAPMRRLRSLADFVIYQSEFCRMSAEKFLGPCGKPSEVLLNPVDLQKFRPREEALPVAPLRLLAMGTQNYRERVMQALDCVRLLRAGGLDCTLTIAGPLIWRHAAADLREAIAGRGLGGAVEVMPPFRQEDAPEICRRHHILLHPKYLDPCPTVVAEALACGLPVVASRSGGVPEMTDPACAELIDAAFVWDRLITPSGGEMAGAVKRLMARLGDASAAARRIAEAKFDAGQWIVRHREFFLGLEKRAAVT